eukprot:1903165-Ditylum_brightwellii.AAC.1
MDHEVFQVDAHARAMEHGKLEGRKQKEEAYKTVRGERLAVVPNAENNSVLGKDKFCDMVLLGYKIIPKDLLKVCNGCGKCHTLQHALQCKTGGLITACHNKSRDDLGLTASQTYTPIAIRDNPKVLTCQEYSVKGECPESAAPQAPQDLLVQVIKSKDKQKDPRLYGELLICGLWQTQTDAIIDVRSTDTDTKSYISKPLESVLAAQENEKRDKYL